MKRVLPIFLLWILLFLLLPAQQVSAQHGEPPPLPPDAWKGQVSGKVVNQTSGETVAEAVEVMLHAWDPDDQQRMMLHGKAEPDGTFLFNDVDFHQDFSYSVMATYLGAAYFSEPGSVQKGDTSLILDARVYETTDDLSTIKIGQLDVLFYIMEEGKLGISQFYAISNTGMRTVKDAVTLPRDRTGTLKFHLPDEAQNVQFGNDPSGSRYVLLPGGFADTAPLLPGGGGSRVVVAFNLPYTGKLPYTYLAPVTVDGVNFLVQQSSGLSLEGTGLEPAGEQAMEDGSKFNIYKASGLKAGESIQLLLRGGAAGGPVSSSAAAGFEKGEYTNLGIGAGVLGLILLGSGVWWWRQRGDGEVEETSEETLEGIMAEIQLLDQAYQRGELSEDEYQENRDRLREQLKAEAEPLLE